MVSLALSAALVVSLLWGGWQCYGKRQAQTVAAYNLRRFRHCRKQYHLLLKTYNNRP